MPDNYGPFYPKDPPSVPLKPPKEPTVPPGGPTVVVPPSYPDANLPDWINRVVPNNPSARDINSVSQSIVERTLSISPHGTYVPVVYGEDYVGPILSLINVSGSWLYIRLVWCVGEIESIEQVEFVDGTSINSSYFHHYTGTSSQGVDGWLTQAVAGYSDTMTDLGADGVNVAYSVMKYPIGLLDSFPRVRAKIKGLKVNSPVPVMESLTAGAGGGADSAEIENGLITATDDSGNGTVIPFIRYYVDDLIDGDDYRFKIEVEEYSNRGTGTASVYWAESALNDDDSNPIEIDGVGTYYGQGSRGTYDATYNALKIEIDGDAGVEMKYRVTVWNADGNTVYKYSDNAGLLLNHLITDEYLGLGLDVNLESLADLVARNDEVLSVENYSEFRSHIGLVLKQKKELSQVIEVVRGYARTSIYNEGGVVRYMPHKPRPVSFTLTAGDIKQNSFKPKIKDFRNVPNVVRVYYTDTTSDPWRDEFVEVATTEAQNGDEPRREARYNLPALQSKPAALRYAYEMLNERLRTFQATFRTHQAVYDHHDGETFTLDLDELGTAQKMKLVNKKKTGPTEYEVLAEKESDSIYSNEIADYETNNPPLISPDPFDVPDVGGVTIGLNVSQSETGIYRTTCEGGWHPSYDYEYRHSFRVELVDNDSGSVVETRIYPQGTSEYILNNVYEGFDYRVDVTVIGFAGTESDTSQSQVVTATGKNFPPSDVPGFQVSSFIGTTTCQWEPADDNNQVWYYEIQFGPADFEWNDANARLVITRIDAYEHITQFIPSGTWDFLIKAVDNAGNQSVNATRASDVAVDDQPDLSPIANGGFLIDESASFGMASHLSDRVTPPVSFDATFYTLLDWSTKTGDTWADMFPNAMSSYTSDPYLSEGDGWVDTGGARDTYPTLYTQSIDAGSVIDGVWSITSTIGSLGLFGFYSLLGGDMIEIISGDAPEISIQLSDDEATWTTYSGMTSVSGTARYMRVRIRSLNKESRWIYRAGDYRYTIHAKIKTEYASMTYSPSNQTYTFARPTPEVQFASISVADSTAYTPSFGYTTSSGEITGLNIRLTDTSGSWTANSVDIKIIARYI